MKPKNYYRLIHMAYRPIVFWILLVCGLLFLNGCAQNKIRTQDKTPMANDRPEEASPKIPVELISKTYWAEQVMAVPEEADPMGRITKITIHHDGLPSTMINTHPKIAERILDIYHGHIKRNWADIGYHFIVDPQGRVWEGRPLNYQGAHVKDFNEGNIGILVLGNFQYNKPNEKSMNALFKLMGYLMKEYKLEWNQVFTHRELVPYQSNECPGIYLQTIIENARKSGGLLSSQ